MRILTIISLCLTISLNIYGTELYIHISAYQADLSALNRKYNNPISEEYYERIETLYQQWLNKLDALHFDRLSPDGKVDYINFRNHLHKKLYFHQIERQQFLQTKDVLDFSRPIDYFIKERREAKKPDAKRLASNFEKSRSQVLASIKNIENKNPFQSARDANFAAQAVESYRKSIAEAYQFYYDYDPEFSWWVKESWSGLEEAIILYAEKIKSSNTSDEKSDKNKIVGNPLGRQALKKELQFEFIPYSPEQLIEEAQKQYSWCEKEMKRAASSLGYTDWKDALEYVKNQYKEPGEWPEVIVNMANEAIRFIEREDLMTIPDLAKETWRTQMLTAEQQKFSPFFLGGEAILIAYPTSEMTYEEKIMSMRGNNPHFARAVVHHELIPGHHMQQFMNQRNYPYRRALGTPFWTEGWALYWEFNLWDKSFAESDEDKIGMLFWRMHRAARIIFSLNYHLGLMSPEECIDFLVEKVGHERANAEAEVRRSFTGGYSPLYQVAYMIGGLQLYSLKHELVTNGSWTEKEFHDFIISQNNIPVELLRVRMLDIEVNKDFKTSWKFLD